MTDTNDKTIPKSPKEAFITLMGLDVNRWEYRGIEIFRGDVKRFEDKDPDKPVLVVSTGELGDIDHGTVTVHISCKHGLRHVCDGCGRVMTVNKWVNTRYKSAPMMGMRTFVRISVPQMRCKKCGIYRKIRCPLVVENHTYTKLLKLDVLEKLHVNTVKNTAEACRIGSWVVYDILEETVQKGLDTQDLSGVTTLFIDEIQSTHGQNYVTLVADQNHRAVCGVNGHDIGSVREVKKWLESKHCDVNKIEYVSADMSTAYKSGVAECFPNAKLIIDKFHLDKMVNEATDKVRKRTNRELHSAGLDFPKRVKYTILYRRKNHDEKHKARMEQVRLYNKELALAFDLKEEFFELFSSSDKNTARSAFFSWYNRCRGSHIVEMIEVSRRLLRRLNDILRYFDHRITNAVSEGLNSVYKRIKAAAYGYKNELNLIQMCLFRKGDLKLSI